MTIKYLTTGKTADVDAGYAARLIEQGKAIPVSEKKKAEKVAKAEKIEAIEVPAEPVNEEAPKKAKTKTAGKE